MSTCLIFMKKVLLFLTSFLYVLAGVNHFWHPEGYLKIMPRFLPWPEAFNYLAGVLEIVFGVLLLPLYTRSFAAWGLVILLILVFPANIQMAVDYKQQGHPLLWLAYLRLPLQLLLVWWALLYTNFYRSNRFQHKAV